MIKVLLPDEKFVPITKITDTLFRVCFDKVPNGDTGYSFFYIEDFKHNPSKEEIETCLSVIRKECEEKAERGFIEDETAESRVFIETSKDARDYLNSITSFPATDVRVGKNESGISVKRNFASQEDFDTFHNTVKAYVGDCMAEMNSRIDAVQTKINNGEYEYHEPEPPVERAIILDKSEINMNVGETVSLFSTVLPVGSDQGTHAEIDNPILTVLPVEVGEFSVTANSAGTCVITITSKVYPDIYAECTVNVTSPKKK